MDGDRNTNFFHRVTKIHNKIKLISSIRNDEEIITDPQRISAHIVNYHDNLFSTNFVLQDSLLVDEIIPSINDTSTNRLLTMLPSKKEIKVALFDLQIQMVLELLSLRFIGRLFIKRGY